MNNSIYILTEKQDFDGLTPPVPNKNTELVSNEMEYKNATLVVCEVALKEKQFIDFFRNNNVSIVFDTSSELLSYIRNNYEPIETDSTDIL